MLGEVGVDAVSLRTMFRSLQRAQQRDYRGQIAAACFNHAVSDGDVSLVLYDVTTLCFEVTTLCFEAEKEYELRKVGYSKERRVDPQIVVGLLVDRAGFPVEIGCFEGNRAETLTSVPIVKQFQDRHGIADIVVVADAGCCRQPTSRTSTMRACVSSSAPASRRHRLTWRRISAGMGTRSPTDS